MTPTVHIHTTPCTTTSQGSASYTATLHANTHMSVISGTAKPGTLPRAELTGAAQALRLFHELSQQGTIPSAAPLEIHFHSIAIADSLIAGRPHLWRNNGWKMSHGPAVADSDLWEQILDLTKGLQVSYSHHDLAPPRKP